MIYTLEIVVGPLVVIVLVPAIICITYIANVFVYECICNLVIQPML